MPGRALVVVKVGEAAAAAVLDAARRLGPVTHSAFTGHRGMFLLVPTSDAAALRSLAHTLARLEGVLWVACCPSEAPPPRARGAGKHAGPEPI